ncbi:MAG TPA: hypothetical protein VFQ23_22590 [Anaerolineales bacterium]|nr:hypothetical protein [Anaerolineales bacterium]
MNSSRLRYEGLLYCFAFLLALGFRFIQLGASSLTDSEANLALQALQIAQGKSPLLDPQPSYILFTSILFAVIESSNFIARFVPALVGSTLVFIPYLFREKLNPRPALILAFLFAFDPGLVALSRQANGTILAVTFLLFAWGLWINRRVISAGIFAALALLSGPSLWAGVLSLGLIWLFRRGTKNESDGDQSQATRWEEVRPVFLPLIVTLLLGGTLFFVSPNGLSAWLLSLPEYLRGWVSPSAITPSRILLAFFAYEPLGIFIAALAIIRGFRTRSDQLNRLSLWLGIALLLGIFYRQPAELVWVIIPLLTLAALELSRSLKVHAEERVEVGIVVLAVFVLLVYIWFNVSNIAVNPYVQIPAVMPFFGQVQNPRYIIIAGASAILVVCLMMVGFGWSPRTARLGAAWSFAIFFSLYSLAAAWGASGLRNPTGVELWSPDPKPLHERLLISSVNDVSEFSLGHIYSQPVTILGIDSPALEWALRNRTVEKVSVLDPQVAPPLVITPPMNELSLPSAYRGQDFTWRQTPVWDQIRNPDWWSWLVYRQLPRENETIILWARDDLFPDARETVQP